MQGEDPEAILLDPDLPVVNRRLAGRTSSASSSLPAHRACTLDLSEVSTTAASFRTSLQRTSRSRTRCRLRYDRCPLDPASMSDSSSSVTLVCADAQHVRLPYRRNGALESRIQQVATIQLYGIQPQPDNSRSAEFGESSSIEHLDYTRSSTGGRSAAEKSVSHAENPDAVKPGPIHTNFSIPYGDVPGE